VQRDPSMVVPSVDACANNRSLDGAARSIDSTDQSIARDMYIAFFCYFMGTEASACASTSALLCFAKDHNFDMVTEEVHAIFAPTNFFGSVQ